MSNLFDSNYDPLGSEKLLQQHIEDALAFDPRATAKENRAVYEVIRRVFKPQLEHTDRIPDRPCLFVGNHSLFALDGYILVPTLREEINRSLRGLGDKFLWSNKTVGNLLLKRGGVMGHPAVCTALMDAGADLLVFPGGAHESVKSADAVYELQWKERYGFVRLAAANGYTIQPMGIVGPDEFYSQLLESSALPHTPLGQLLKKIGLINDETRTDMLPPIPRGSLGTLFPRPQTCYVGFGHPIDLSELQGQKLDKTQLRAIRDQVAREIKYQLAEMLTLREQLKGRDGLLRRFLRI